MLNHVPLLAFPPLPLPSVLRWRHPELAFRILAEEREVREVVFRRYLLYT